MQAQHDAIVIEHPAGTIETRVELANTSANEVPAIVRAGVVRTARLLMAGHVFVIAGADRLVA